MRTMCSFVECWRYYRTVPLICSMINDLTGWVLGQKQQLKRDDGDSQKRKPDKKQPKPEKPATPPRRERKQTIIKHLLQHEDGGADDEPEARFYDAQKQNFIGRSAFAVPSP